MMVQLAAMATVDEAELYEVPDKETLSGEPIDNDEGEAVEGDGDIEPEAVKPSEPTGWEAEALEQIKLARDHVARMEVCYLAAKEEAKDCKASWEAAVTHLTKVIDEATKPMPLFDRTAPKDETPADPTDESWRATPIDEIFLGIKGLGEKKRDAIREAIPTLGAFEDLRKKASLAGDPLREHMPKGVGQEACDQLEEASLNAISRIMTLGDDDEDEDSERDK